MSDPGARLSGFGGGNSTRLRAFGSRYTWFVRVTKFALPLVALALVAIVITRLSQQPQQLQLSDLPQQEKTTPGQSELVSARYEGIDDQNRPYTITADHAVRDMKSLQAVSLDKPKGRITLNDGWLAVEGAKGFYDNTAGKLNLSGGVVLTHSTGYTLHLQDADVDVHTRHAITALPIYGSGPAGEITAQNMEVTEGGDLLIFGGPATLVLRQTNNKKVPG